MSYSPGLAGIIAAETRISHVDGQAGELIIGGYPLATLVEHATYEEVVFLLWHDRLPTPAELREFQAELAGTDDLPPATLNLLREATDADIMDVLRMGIGTLASTSDAHHDAVRAVAAMPQIVAAAWRIRQGLAPIAPDPSLGHAANYLYMLSGTLPTPQQVAALNAYLVTGIDHGMNASTFTGRVIISTGSDVISAVTGAVGALKGPLHGGAPGPALDMVFEIGRLDRAEASIRAQLGRGEVIMGFGHRVYKVRDPRADALGAVAERLYAGTAQADLYRLALDVEAVVLRVLAEVKPGRPIFTNVEYYTALVLHGLGMPVPLFTPTFAVSRVGGWTAHCFEQIAAKKIIRPASAYTGEMERVWVPMTERATVPLR